MDDVRVCEYDIKEVGEFKALVQSRIIKGGEKFKVVLWAHCLAYHAVYSAMRGKTDDTFHNLTLRIPQGDLEVASKYLDCTLDAESSTVSSLLQKVYAVVGAPPPNPSYLLVLNADDHQLKMRYEVLANALAFIFYHELSHIYHKHEATPGNVRKEQEFHADRTAAEWLFGNKGIDTNMYSGRHFGAATVLIGLTSTLLYERYDSNKHPPAWERILPVFEPSVKNDDAPVWGYIATGLYLHLHRHRVYLENESDLRPDKITVCRMISAIAEHNARLELSPCP